MRPKSLVRGTMLAALLPFLVACGGGSDPAPATGGGATGSSSSSGGVAASSSSSSGAGSSSSSSSSSSSGGVTFTCSGTEWFCEDFQSGTSAKWTTLPSGGATSIGTANGTISFPQDGTNTSFQYDAGSSKGVVAVVTDAAFTGVTGRATADYYVEARIKPINNSTTNKYICLLGRYVDPNNWNGGCLNVQNSASSKVEFHKATTAGGWNRTKQFSPNRVILNDVWYKLRLEMVGSSMTLYIDDELVGTQVDTSNSAAGKIGIWLDNRSFAIDDIVVGDATIKPVLLSVSPNTTWIAEVGDADRSIAVTATKSDTTVDTYTAVSSNPSVIAVTNTPNATGGTTVLKAVGAGSATVTFTSGSKASLTKSVSATISPAFVMPTATYSGFAGKTVPAAASTGAYVDETLALTFDSPPTIGSNGSVRIFKSSDDSLVDTIKLTGEANTIGPAVGNYYRGVATPLVRVSGNKLLVRPHMNKLAYNTQYYVAVAGDVVTNSVTLNGTAFTGVGKTTGWSFTTRAAPTAGLATVLVDDDGSSADFRSVQGALNYVMANGAPATAATINVNDGTYNELLYLRGRDNVTIRGQSRSGTVIAAENYDSRNTGSGAGSTTATVTAGGGRSLFLIEDADLLTLDTLTMENTHLKVIGVAGQAEVLYYNSAAKRLVAKNANFISRQDTIQTNGFAWFYNTLIAGDVDFIWGSAKAALFENSEIRTRVDSTDALKGGYIIQARVASASDKGYVFLNSSLTREPAVPDGATVLGRSAGNGSFDNVTYVNVKMDAHIAAAGWQPTSPVPNPGTATATSGWKEYGSTKLDNSPLDISGRSTVARTLNTGEATAFDTRAAVFSAFNSGAGWNPTP
ncbi:pectinesterase family protein [Uliginosibacterium sp. H1]|uniref:pectinesterase family protein n=1 Tax=Uliginosibacterium sp. H1 TaxID=3114757 RepID=UPI002E186F65|nr:pectinesterase family protein [Uliginosibacterium sp. H1]